MDDFRKKHANGSWIVGLAAWISAPIYYAAQNHPSLEKWQPALYLIGIFAGCVGFCALMIWNILLRKKSLIHMNAFLAFWMMAYFITIVLFHR